MATLQALQQQVRVGEELHSVVRTMKGLAAVSIREYEKAVEALGEYTANLERAIQVMLIKYSGALQQADSPVAPGHRSRRAAVYVVGTDQGMCGSINQEMARYARGWVADHDRSDPMVIGLGDRAVRELQQAGVEVTRGRSLPGSVEGIGPMVDDLVVEIDELRRDHEVERVMFLFQHPQSRTEHRPRTFQVVPPDLHRLEAIGDRDWPTNQIPDSPHSATELVAGLLRDDLSIALFRAIAEGKVSEHGARLAAMQAAEQNIEERLDDLRRDLHQARQAEITSRLLEVVSGFEALADD